MPRDAITHLAEARQVDEQPLLEQGWERVVEVREACKPPQVRQDLRVWYESEEVRQQAEAIHDLDMLSIDGCQFHVGRGPSRIAGCVGGIVR